MHASALKDDFMWLRAQGMSFGKIAAQLNVPKSTLVMWSNENNDEIARFARIIKATPEEALGL